MAAPQRCWSCWRITPTWSSEVSDRSLKEHQASCIEVTCQQWHAGIKELHQSLKHSTHCSGESGNWLTLIWEVPEKSTWRASARAAWVLRDTDGHLQRQKKSSGRQHSLLYQSIIKHVHERVRNTRKIIDLVSLRGEGVHKKKTLSYQIVESTRCSGHDSRSTCSQNETFGWSCHATTRTAPKLNAK